MENPMAHSCPHHCPVERAGQLPVGHLVAVGSKSPFSNRGSSPDPTCSTPHWEGRQRLGREDASLSADKEWRREGKLGSHVLRASHIGFETLFQPISNRNRTERLGDSQSRLARCFGCAAVFQEIHDTGCSRALPQVDIDVSSNMDWHRDACMPTQTQTRLAVAWSTAGYRCWPRSQIARKGRLIDLWRQRCNRPAATTVYGMPSRHDPFLRAITTPYS